LDVLFIGNSLTYTNDLPSTLAFIAATNGDIFRVSMVAGPKKSLMDHLADGVAEAAIRGGMWDVVVLQDNADADSASRELLIQATEEFNTILQSVGAQPALYMVWPPANMPSGFCETRVSYQMAAAAVNGVFLPAGAAWELALGQDPALGLYDPDGIHPSALGTYLVAITMHETLTGHDARRLPPYAVVNGVRLNVSTDTVRLLQGFAHTASTGGISNHGCTGTAS